MKNLYESILDDIDVQMQHGDEFQKHGDKLGYYFVFDSCVCYEDLAGMFKASSLKKLTNGLSYNNEQIKRGYFDKRNKVKMLANWLDNLSLSDIGIKLSELTKSNLTNKEWRVEFGKKVEKCCIENDVFNNSDIAHLFTSTFMTNGNNLTLFIVNTKRMSKAIRLNYKINQNI